METKAEIVSKLKELKPTLEADYAVKSLGLFGSFADDTATEESDVDILVEFKKPIGWRFFTLEKYLEKMLGRKIDLVTPNAVKEQLRNNIFGQLQYI